MDKEKEVVSQEEQGVVSVTKVKELMETVAHRVADRLLVAFGIEEKPKEEKAPELSKEMSDGIDALPVADAVKASIRKDILTMTATDQATWLKSFSALIQNPLSLKQIQAEDQKTETVSEEVSSETSQPTEVESKKEEVMAAVNVKADAKQNSKAGEVSGFQSGESASSGPKGNVPSVPGKVVTEAPAIQTLPKPVKTGHELKTDHEAMAAKADKEIEALKRNKGLVTEKSKLASTMLEVRKIAAADPALVESFVAYAKKKSKVSPKAKEYIGSKIKKLKEEGKTKEQASGQAYGMAREKGMSVPESKEA
jgi:hypothetical protein